MKIIEAVRIEPEDEAAFNRAAENLYLAELFDETQFKAASSLKASHDCGYAWAKVASVAQTFENAGLRATGAGLAQLAAEARGVARRLHAAADNCSAAAKEVPGV